MIKLFENFKKINELKQATPSEYYGVLDNMFIETPELLQAIKHFDSTFPPDSKTIYKTDDDSLFIQYAEVEDEIYFGPGLYILGMASKTKKMNRKSIQDMYEILEMFKDMIYPGLNIFASVNSYTEPLLKRLTNIIKEKGLTSNQEILDQHDFGTEPEEQYTTYELSVNESYKNYAYHVTKKENIPGILKKGINSRKGFLYRYGKKEPIPNDVYVWKTKEMAEWFKEYKENESDEEYRILTLNISGLDLRKDPETEDMSVWSSNFETGQNGHGYICSNSISKDRIIESLAGMYDDVETAIKNNKKIKNKKEFDSLRKYMKTLNKVNK